MLSRSVLQAESVIALSRAATSSLLIRSLHHYDVTATSRPGQADSDYFIPLVYQGRSYKVLIVLITTALEEIERAREGMRAQIK